MTNSIDSKQFYDVLDKILSQLRGEDFPALPTEYWEVASWSRYDPSQQDASAALYQQKLEDLWVQVTGTLEKGHEPGVQLLAMLGRILAVIGDKYK